VRAILSVFDKTGLVDFARGLEQLKIDIFSTGGTKKALEEGGVAVKSVSELTGFPEMLDGRVKTLHPAIHGGILAKRNLSDHLAQLAERGIGTIDLVAVNLYPFVQTVAKPDVTLDEALENIDIGGPTMIRAAAKNFPSVLVVVAPADYGWVLEDLRGGEVGLERRRKLAQKAFQHVAIYDTAISEYLRRGQEGFPEQMTVALTKRADLRYGENPHQQAAFYSEEGVLAKGLPALLAGGELSYCNVLDADAAWNVVCDFSAPTVAVIKHTNPCGLACHDDLTEAYRRAYAGDPVSAFGGIVGVNRKVNRALARAMRPHHYDIIVAPEYDADASTLLKRKDGLRILAVGPEAISAGGRETPRWEYRRAWGGLLVQSPDVLPEDSLKLRTVTKREPAAEEMRDLLFAWRAVKHVKSNAILIAKDLTLLGMGAGQPNRVISVELALKQAGDKSRGSVLASDAMFPFSDSVEMAARGGVTAIIQPGGSLRDEDSIKAANEHNIAMVLTGFRHFKH
jgi:phosphoribosylaminoimidazolecarboxamide formyltransferase/IMP cyclohydrolase